MVFLILTKDTLRSPLHPCFLSCLQLLISLRLSDIAPTNMDYKDQQDLRRILRTDEEMIQGNRSSIFTVTEKVHENEQRAISQIASIMGTLLQLKQKIANLEAECVMLRNLVVLLSKDAYLGASNQRALVKFGQGALKEEATRGN
jgi:hypothetical protein